MATLTFRRPLRRGPEIVAALIVAFGMVVGFARRHADVVPGLGGACGLSAATGGIVETYAGQGGPWIGLFMLSLFLLAMDRQIQPRGQG